MLFTKTSLPNQLFHFPRHLALPDIFLSIFSQARQCYSPSLTTALFAPKSITYSRSRLYSPLTTSVTTSDRSAKTSAREQCGELSQRR